MQGRDDRQGPPRLDRTGGPIRRTEDRDGPPRLDRTGRPIRRTDDREGTPGRKGWGGVARRGARVLGEASTGSASEAWREAVARSRNEADKGTTTPPPEWEPEVWEEVGDDRPKPGRRPPSRREARDEDGGEWRRSRRVPQARGELDKAVGPTKAPRMEAKLAEAVRAYERDRYLEAVKILKPLAEAAPGAPTVRELYGLTLYRLGRWRLAIKELEAFRDLAKSFDQHPVLADCNRALRKWDAVNELWLELRYASPGAELVAEGRIVYAGALGDQGRLNDAIRELERAAPSSRAPKLHHLRTWYALADLYERAGDLPKARHQFRQILRHDPGFVDVPERLAALG